MLRPFINVEGGEVDWMFSHPATLQSPSLKRTHQSSPLPPPVHHFGPTATTKIHGYGRNDDRNMSSDFMQGLCISSLYIFDRESSLLVFFAQKTFQPLQNTYLYPADTFFYAPENYIRLFSRCNALTGQHQTARYKNCLYLAPLW